MTDPDRLSDSRTVLVELHVRLSAGDETAADELCCLLHPKLLADVRRRLYAAEPHEISTAVNDALLRYLRNPALFDPARGALDIWLLKIAVNRARDLRRGARRRLAREVPFGTELPNVASSHSGRSGHDVTTRHWRKHVLSCARNANERRFLHARLAGAPIAQQAIALGVDTLSKTESRRVVYRTIDRIIKRAQRLLRK